jgi:hypothetical protein
VAVSYQHLRESQALHLAYYKRKEKKIFHVKETSLWHPRAPARGDAFSVTPTPARQRSEQRRHQQRESVKLQKCLSNSRFFDASSCYSSARAAS